MKVSELSAILQTISPDAEVKLLAKHRPESDLPSDLGSGSPIYVAVTAVDGSDTLVMLCNYLADQRGNDVFDAPPQFKRFRIDTGNGVPAAVADLIEQAGCEPTQDLHVEAEKEKLRDIFRSFEDLLNQTRTIKEN